MLRHAPTHSKQATSTGNSSEGRRRDAPSMHMKSDLFPVSTIPKLHNIYDQTPSENRGLICFAGYEIHELRLTPLYSYFFRAIYL